MNSKAALLLMLCAIVIASLLHGRKISAKDNDMDRLAKGLAGVRCHLNPNAPVFLDNRTPKGEFRFMARYLLVPVITNIKETGDTILTISENNNTLSADSARKLLWSNSDTLYHYTLTCHL